MPHFNAELLLTLMKLSYIVVLAMGILNFNLIQETVAEYDFENDSYSYYDNQLQNSIVLNMAAGDTFHFTSYADVYAGTTHTNMSAYLLG